MTRAHFIVSHRPWVRPCYWQATAASLFKLGQFLDCLLRYMPAFLLEPCHNDCLPGPWVLLCCHGAPEISLWLLNRISPGASSGNHHSTPHLHITTIKKTDQYTSRALLQWLTPSTKVLYPDWQLESSWPLCIESAENQISLYYAPNICTSLLSKLMFWYLYD